MESNVSTYPNCTDHNPYPDTQAFLRVCLILPTILFGVAANIVNISIFCNRRMPPSKVNWFLLTLAISDTLLLISTVLMLPFPVLAERSKAFFPMLLAEYLTRWFYPIGLVAQTRSVYLVVTVSAYRYLGICWPFMAQRWGTATNVKIVIASTILFSLAFNAVRWGSLITVQCFSVTFNRVGVKIGMNAYASSKTYRLYYRVIAYIIVMFLIPFLTLCILDVQLVRALRQSLELRKASTRTPTVRAPAAPVSVRQTSNKRLHLQLHRRRGEKKEEQDSSKENMVTMMLLAIVALFLACNSLPFVNNILEVLHTYTSLFDNDPQFPSRFSTSVEIGNLLVTINSSAYIFIYTAFNRKYRELLKNVICRRGLKRHERSSTINGETTALLTSTCNSERITHDLSRFCKAGSEKAEESLQDRETVY